MANVYSVWAGGTEVNDHYLSLDEAFNLADVFEREGYEDICIEKVFSQEIKLSLEEANGVSGQIPLLQASINLLAELEDRVQLSSFYEEDKKKMYNIVGIAIKTLSIIYTEEKVLGFLETRSHWADHYCVNHHVVEEAISLLKEIIANTATLSNKGMSVKPLMKLLGNKEC